MVINTKSDSIIMAMSSENPVSLATAQNNDKVTVVGVAGGSLDINENLREGLFSTCGATEYTSRTDIGEYVILSSMDKGAQVFEVPLKPDLSQDTVLSDLAKRFIYFSIESVSIVFKCIAPWSTASGSMQVFYNPDPSNPLSTDLQVAIKQALRLAQSKQLSSKGEASLVCDIPREQASKVFKGVRYCKAAANPVPRTESFGYIGGIVRGKPSMGDGTSWTATLVMTFKFMDMTFNTTTTPMQVVISQAVSGVTIQSSSTGSGDILAVVSTATTGTASAGTFQPYDVDQYEIVLQQEDAEGGSVTEKYDYTNNIASYIDDGATLTIWLQTRYSQSRTAIDDPELATVSTNLSTIRGSLLYIEDAVGPGMQNNCVVLNQSNKSFMNAMLSFRGIMREVLMQKYKKVFYNK